tara:strand:- start:2031 stop:2270 length:240 start_codon:yes stop_codon:yes gene_type:complete
MRTFKKENNYNCKIIDFNGNCIHNKDYRTLPEIAVDLQLSKDVIYNLSSRKGNYNTLYKNFKYQPKIEISRIIKNAETD